MAQKKVYYYRVQAFGDPVSPGLPAKRLSLHDVFTTIASLDLKKTDTTGRVFKCPPEIDAEHLFVHVSRNDPALGRIYGMIGEIRSKNLPDFYDWATGSVSNYNHRHDLIEKSYFVIDTFSGDMLFYRHRNSPSTGLLALYVMEKSKPLVRSFVPEMHFRKDALDQIAQEERKGKIKSFELKIKKEAVSRSGLLGDSVETALTSLASFPDVDSIGIQLSIGKKKRRGGFALDGVMEGLKKFMGLETSDTPFSEIEKANFRLEEETINLLTKKFGTYMYLPDKLFQQRNVDVNAVFAHMEYEYERRMQELSQIGSQIPQQPSALEPKENPDYEIPG